MKKVVCRVLCVKVVGATSSEGFVFYPLAVCRRSAVLGSEFREQPRSADVAIGSDVLMGCRPPRGEPEPRVRWRKDGDPVRPDERMTVSDSGTLRIRDAGTEDSGVYVCIAFNIGGEKESSAARLTVRGTVQQSRQWVCKSQIP